MNASVFPIIARLLIWASFVALASFPAYAQMSAPLIPMAAPMPSRNKTGCPNAYLEPMIISEARFDKTYNLTIC